MQSFITASLSRADRMRCVPERRFRTDESKYLHYNDEFKIPLPRKAGMNFGTLL